MTGTDWILIDTETSGLVRPIYCVELAAQRMRGVAAIGEPFRALLDHDVAIDPMAQSIHGYSRDYLRQHGNEPSSVHADFIQYAGTLPVVAFNLSFDWARVLEPELKRLELAGNYYPGFCALTLARRCIHETASHGLQRLRAHFFPYHRGVAHRALDDVAVTSRLIAEVLWPRLERAGVRTFGEVAKFSRATPVAACRQRLRRPTDRSTRSDVMEASTCRADASDEELLAVMEKTISKAVLEMSDIAALRRWLEARRGFQSGTAMRCRGLVEVAFGADDLRCDERDELRGRLAALVREAGKALA